MKQVVMVGPRKSEVVDVPIPEITDDQLLVKVTYTGLSLIHISEPTRH